MLLAAYVDNVVYQRSLEEPVQLNRIVFDDILPQHNSFSK